MSLLRDRIEAAERIVILTGAGVSTDSGIPDYRSAGGIWERFQNIQYADFLASEAARLEDWKTCFCMDDMLERAEPNLTHRVIAGWVRAGKCTTVVTQNIDGLHQKAGADPEAVVEIHGSARQARCIECGERHDIADCRAHIEKTGTAPRCAVCGGLVKSAIVMFGENLPERALERAWRAAASCDLILAMGTSLQVYPAAGLPELAQSHGADFGIINRDPTPLDADADFTILSALDDVLAEFETTPLR